MATLYAARGGGQTTSNLYTVNPQTGGLTSIGPIGFALTGLAFDPTSGILYGVTSGNSGASPRHLITVDPSTGDGTVIGDLTKAITDISFADNGALYGWTGTSPRLLHSINKTTGLATQIGTNQGYTGSGNALEFDHRERLLQFPTGAFGTYYSVNLTTSVRTSVGQLDGGFSFDDDIKAAAFNSHDGYVYAVVGDKLGKIESDFEHIIEVGSFSVTEIDALAWSDPEQTVFCVTSTDDVNEASGTVVEVGPGELYDTQSYNENSLGIVYEPTATFYVRGENLPPPGRYAVTLTVKRDPADVNRDQAYVQLRREGYPIGNPTIELLVPSATFVDVFLTSANGVDPTDSAVPITPYIDIGAGDEIEVCIAQTDWVVTIEKHMRVQRICFTKIADLPEYSGSFDRFSTTGTVVELDSGSSTTTPNSEDILAMNELLKLGDDIYCVFTEGTSHPYAEGRGPFLARFSGGSWTILNSGNPLQITSGAYVRSPSIATDGEDIWIGWVEESTATSNSFRFRCKKFDVSAGTFTEIGSGLSNFTNTSNFVNRATIAVSPNDSADPSRLYVAFKEQSGISPFSRTPYVFKWNGTTWVNTNVPLAAGVTDFDSLEGNGETIREIDLTFCHSDGPSAYPSVAYTYLNGTTGLWGFLYSEYNGTSWSDTFGFTCEDFSQIERNTINGLTEGIHLIDDGQRPILGCVIFENGYLWPIVLKLNSAGTAFERLGDFFPANITPFGTNEACIWLAADGQGKVYAAYSDSGIGDRNAFAMYDPCHPGGWAWPFKENKPHAGYGQNPSGSIVCDASGVWQLVYWTDGQLPGTTPHLGIMFHSLVPAAGSCPTAEFFAIIADYSLISLR